MVKAILEGRKTQTRRVIKPQPVWDLESSFWKAEDWLTHCPYGQVGDRLWVRETWSYGTKNQQPNGVIYKADGTLLPDSLARGSYSATQGWGKWSPSIFMPKWAARTWLEITKERVERVQEITREDIEREGCSNAVNNSLFFPKVWDSLNAKRGFGWDTNPWVWVIGFKKCD